MNSCSRKLFQIDFMINSANQNELVGLLQIQIPKVMSVTIIKDFKYRFRFVKTCITGCFI